MDGILGRVLVSVGILLVHRKKGSRLQKTVIKIASNEPGQSDMGFGPNE